MQSSAVVSWQVSQWIVVLKHKEENYFGFMQKLLKTSRPESRRSPSLAVHKFPHRYDKLARGGQPRPIHTNTFTGENGNTRKQKNTQEERVL